MKPMQMMSKKLLTIFLLLPLLAACRGAPNQWQTWISDLLEGPPATVPVPSDDGAPGLAPTPTLAAGASTDAPAPQPTAIPSDDPTTDEAPADPTPGPFTGTFAGTIEGYNDSSASLQLELVQRGRQIEGAATLGEGLVVNAGGVCGSFPIPATTLTARDELDQVDGRHLMTTTTVQISGLEIPVELDATLAPDGQTVAAQATIYPPSLCGRTPTLNAELTRVNPDG